MAKERERTTKPNFRKKEKKPADRRLYAPADGRLIPLTEVKVADYAAKLYGEGIGVDPQGDLIVSPCTGSVVLVGYNKQCIGLETELGDQILVHIGVDTGMYRGRGFEILAPEGTRVRPGTPLCRIDRRFFDLQNADMTVFMVVTSPKGAGFKPLEAEALTGGHTPVMEKR